MITVTTIFGLDAVVEFNTTGKIPSQKWLEDHGGVVDEKSFKTKLEHDAYVEGINAGKDWGDCYISNPEGEPEDCKYCEDWRKFFADRKSIVYCPDCGQLILNG